MILYFLRHASAGEPVSNPKKDEKRALDETGVEQCGYVGRALAALDVQVDVIISSPLKRAAQTASLVGNEMGYEGKLQLEHALRPPASFAAFRKMLDKYIRHDAIMVVGHNPTLSEFLGRAISESGCEAALDLKKGAVARAEMSRNSASLTWCLTPKILRTLYAAAAETSRPKTSRKKTCSFFSAHSSRSTLARGLARRVSLTAPGLIRTSVARTAPLRPRLTARDSRSTRDCAR